MGNRIIKGVGFGVLFALVLGACGARENETLKKRKPSVRAGGDEVVRLSGGFTLLDGMRSDLGTLDPMKPSVVYFVSDTCTVCAAEADKLVKIVGENSAPSKINLASIVVGAVRDDAFDWKERHEVGWLVGFQPPGENASLLRTYCPAVQTPCVVVSTPEKGVVFAENGPVSPEKIMSLTGDWK